MAHYYILSILFIGLVAGCPETEVPPCSCRMIGFHSSVITCINADDVDALRNSIQNMRSLPIRQMQIFDSNLMYLPHNLFKELKIENLILSTTSLMSLSDSDTAFEGLEDTLEKLTIQECTILNGLDWQQLRNLKALKELKTVKTGLQALDEEIKGVAELDLTYLLLTQDKISYITDNAFSSLSKLTVLSLKYNLITDLKRNMFPNPANELSNLILSNNKIASLPIDFFTNMPNLVAVSLGDNYFLTMDEELFAPLWKNLNKIDMTGNTLRCDCRMKWILNKSFPRNTWGACNEPSTLHDKEITKLTEQDLYCF